MSFAEDFQRDVAAHLMIVLRDDGVSRHLRFKRPETMCMHFDLITWPGYLCYTGDMGTFVFRRLHDMFEFFRCPADRQPFQIDLRYWAEKVEASDKHGGLRTWSADRFRAEVRDFFNQHVDDEWTAARKADLWSEIEDAVCGAADVSEHHAWTALWDFSYDGFRFQDWGRDCQEWTHRFEWCCHALQWAIAIYDDRPAALRST